MISFSTSFLAKEVVKIKCLLLAARPELVSFVEYRNSRVKLADWA
jgi:hypothetical protein